MSHISRDQLMRASWEAWELARQYKTRDRSEFTIDRLLFGLFRGAGHVVIRQYKVKCLNADRRVDFLIGGKTTGAFVELVVRRNGVESCVSQISSELNKLCRANGRQRAIIIIDTSGRSPLTKQSLKRGYEGWRSSPGRYKRNSVCVIYSAGPCHTFAFGLRVARVM
jgi:hypothetical protein